MSFPSVSLLLLMLLSDRLVTAGFYILFETVCKLEACLIHFYEVSVNLYNNTAALELIRNNECGTSI